MIHCPFYAISWQKLLADRDDLNASRKSRYSSAQRTRASFQRTINLSLMSAQGPPQYRRYGQKGKLGQRSVLVTSICCLTQSNSCLPSALPSAGHISSPSSICHVLASLGLLWPFSGCSEDMIPVMSCALYVQACLAAGLGSTGAHSECMP